MPATPRAATGYVSYMPTAWWASLDTGERTPEVVWPRSIEVFARMRREEAQVRSVLRAVTLPLGRARWWINPAGARPEVAQWVADDLGLPIKGQDVTARRRNKDRFSWAEHLRLALTALTFGHSFFEQSYRYDDTAGLLHLQKLLWLPPWTIAGVAVARDGGLVELRQYQLGLEKWEPIPVSALVAYSHEREGADWWGQSLLRSAYKDWLLKDQALRVQAQVTDRNGLGVPVYTASEPAEGGAAEDRQKVMDDELDAGEELVQQYRSGDNAGAAIPHGSQLALQGVSGKLPDIIAWIRYLDEQMARAVLAHFLNLGTETGSWALGSTFADFFTLGLQAVAGWVKDIVNQHVVEDLVDVNWGPDEPAPLLEHEEIGSSSGLTAEGLQALVTARILTPDGQLEAYLREQHGLPIADSATARQPVSASPAPPSTQEAS